MRVQSNDNVLITKGRDRGKQGRISRVLPKQDTVVVEGINVVTRHQKPTGNFRAGGMIQKEMPIPVGNVALICAHCNKPTRIGYTRLADETKARVCQKCKEVVE
ncbi:MAG: 50S ribosomal protein L24 [SAR202 cluster bacterium]|jgi:large subunit ribosomal protein L24|nr:50S ribosomal protein L24 [SAR202 cluster bacterium]MDP7103632.1 50S ribosomal protein L24 [SAR202 cluster bacterium]MDP7412505.1 50S ribosomal protein L24 [SAR202 cluster bacterium]MDP7534003.1 50S ribosomal protein L24 [SAR202 cluster bacterium]HJO81462.1 50S ribosomal protein L24 [SAR202 cluster bacterium]